MWNEWLSTVRVADGMAVNDSPSDIETDASRVVPVRSTLSLGSVAVESLDIAM